jgi:predicted secreted protein
MRSMLIFVLAAAVAAPLASARSSDVRKIGPKANGTTVLLHTSDVLVVSLPGNATTGYGWRIFSIDKTVLKHLGTRYVPKKAVPGQVVGSGGTYVLRFRAVGPGASPLKLGYVQAGRKAVIARRFAVDVNVKGFPQV